MRQLCIIGRDYSGTDIMNGTEGTFELEGISVRHGLIETPDPDFDPSSDDSADGVLLRVKAFSCNYRDRALILTMSTSRHQKNYYVIGSEFVGEVLAVGRNVRAFKPGDRVIADASYPDSGVPGLAGGLPTNHGSRELQIIHHNKLIGIPDNMPDDVAAGFTIGAQTAYSMIRRLDLRDNDNVLVTGAKSNTSLFAIAALRQRPVQVFGLSTSERHGNDLAALGLNDLFVVDPSRSGWTQEPRLAKCINDMTGFDAAIDPFSDVYVSEIPHILTVGGRHVTCGIADQHSKIVGKDSGIEPINVSKFMSMLVIKNISIMGNCLGRTSDLRTALDDYTAGELSVPVHSQVTPGETGKFFSDTFLTKERFGKVAFHYD